MVLHREYSADGQRWAKSELEKARTKRQGLSRGDVYAPDTGPDAVRENGQIVAVRGLVV